MTEKMTEAELVMRYRRATGLPVLAAKHFLQPLSHMDRIATIDASENAIRTEGMARDPQEDDHDLGPIIHSVLDRVAEREKLAYDNYIDEMRKTAPAIAEFLAIRRGICHKIWRTAKAELLAEHGIEWKTPVEMNPNCAFD